LMGWGADSLLSAGWCLSGQGRNLPPPGAPPDLASPKIGARRPSHVEGGMEQGRTYDPQTKKPPGEARRLSISLLRAG
jgi:hypothetical protein